MLVPLLQLGNKGGINHPVQNDRLHPVLLEHGNVLPLLLLVGHIVHRLPRVLRLPIVLGIVGLFGSVPVGFDRVAVRIFSGKAHVDLGLIGNVSVFIGEDRLVDILVG